MIIHILFDATYIDPTSFTTSRKTFVLSGACWLDPSTFTVAQVQLPGGIPTGNILSINANGVLATADLSWNQSSPQYPKVGLLLPVSLNVMQPDYGTGTVHGGWNVTRNALQTPWFVFTATMPWIASGSLNVVQDFQCTYTVTYQDGSYTYCALPDFMADYTPVFVAPAAIVGNMQYGGDSDRPQCGITTGSNGNPGPRNYIKTVQISGTARDFATVQIGNGAPQVVSQVNWMFSEEATFKPNPATGGTSTYLTTNFPTLVPAASGTSYGALPSATPVPSQRISNPGSDDSVNTYLNKAANWHPVTTSGTIANIYPCP